MKNHLDKKNLTILAIETSCDETAAAVISVGNEPKILSNIVSSQVDLHALTGGVVPEVASRAHVEAIIPVVSEALLKAKYGEKSLDNIVYSDAIEYLHKNITHIAYTAGPGLIGSLLVGYNAAKTIAYSLDLPIIPINHIEGHIYSAYNFKNRINFPLISLTVSGGHTSLTLVKDHGKYENIGSTLDDAAGEAFDKVAKLLDLGYPGGPAISKLANEYRENLKCPHGIVFPRPIINDGTFNFSFSGLKTAVLQVVLNIRKERELSEADKLEISAAFEDAVVDVLTTKTIKAVQKYNVEGVVLAGGVAANKQLRKILKDKIEILNKNIELYIPPISLCGDNAAMIGLAANFHLLRGDTVSWKEADVDSNLELTQSSCHRL